MLYWNVNIHIYDAGKYIYVTACELFERIVAGRWLLVDCGAWYTGINVIDALTWYIYIERETESTVSYVHGHFSYNAPSNRERNGLPDSRAFGHLFFFYSRLKIFLILSVKTLSYEFIRKMYLLPVFFFFLSE